MRRGVAISERAHTGQSEEIHSQEAWASTVVSDTVWMSWSMMVVCNVAISCRQGIRSQPHDDLRLAGASCIDPSLFIKRVCPSGCLTIFPATGHAVNLEEVDLFNRIVGEFLAQIDSGR
jgi:hypothetical protein